MKKNRKRWYPEEGIPGKFKGDKTKCDKLSYSA